MSKELQIKLIKYGLSAAVTLGLAGWYIGARDFAGAELVDKYCMLCDAFSIPGIVLVMLGCMLWVSNEGVMHGVTWVLGFSWRALIPGKRKNVERYYDYVQRKRAKGKVTGYGFLFVVGGISLGIALVFMILFYRLYW